MFSLLEKYQQAMNEQDVFSLWETEVQLRTQIRTLPVPAALKIQSAAELDLLFRAFYFTGRKYDFFNVLFTSLNHLESLKWITSAPAEILADFLSYLPWYIKTNCPHPPELQFLINLYHDSFEQYYHTIIGVLDLSCCDYLIARTANTHLRNLLGHQHRRLLAHHEDLFYGLSASGISKGHNSIFGNKAEIIINTINSIEQSRSVHFREPYCSERFQRLLQCAEMIFECGLVEDCLAVLIDTYQDYQEKNRLVDMLEDEKINKHFYQLLRKTIPMHALLNRKGSTFYAAEQMYHRCFPRISVDQGSLIYLQLADGIDRANTSGEEHILLELLALGSKINRFRPGEAELFDLQLLHKGCDPAWLEAVVKAARQKITSLPHETYVIAEFVRQLDARKVISLEIAAGAEIYRYYLDLWQWVPSRLFVNPDIARQIVPFLEDGQRLHLRQILAVLDHYDNNTIKMDLSTRPDIFKNKEAAARREILWGKFLGVL